MTLLRRTARHSNRTGEAYTHEAMFLLKYGHDARVTAVCAIGCTLPKYCYVVRVPHLADINIAAGRIWGLHDIWKST